MTDPLNWPIDRLVAHHLANDLSDAERGAIANELLRRVSSGSELEPLAPLIDAPNEQCIRTATFILSEIGTRSIAAMAWLDDLLNADSDWVRHHAVLAVQHSGSLEHPATTASALRKLYDVRSVRLAAVRFAAHGSLKQIRTAIGHVTTGLAEGLTWLVTESYEDVGALIPSSDIGVELVGLAGLHRAGGPVDRLPASHRAELADANAWINRTRLPVESRDVLHRNRYSDEP